MKTQSINKLLKQFFFMLALSHCFNAFAQTYPDLRGLYVDDFLKIYSDDVHVNPYFSILGVDAGGQNYSKEDALLEYCKQNHITHIALYDLHWLSDHLNDPYKATTVKLLTLPMTSSPRGPERRWTSFCEPGNEVTARPMNAD